MHLANQSLRLPARYAIGCALKTAAAVGFKSVGRSFLIGSLKAQAAAFGSSAIISPNQRSKANPGHAPAAQTPPHRSLLVTIKAGFTPSTQWNGHFTVTWLHRGVGQRQNTALLQISLTHWSSSLCGAQSFFSSADRMASSVKTDLNSPTISWKEAKNYLKGLNSKERREHYSVKDFIKTKTIPAWKDTAKKMNIKQLENVKYPKNKALNEKISLFRGDITKLEVDGIVNAANSSLLGGGGVDGCIHRAAGPLLKLECSSLNGCQTGLAKMTCGYLLPAKYVIHTVGPVVQGQLGANQEEELKNCYRNSLQVATETKLRSLAFPCISTGVFGYPAESAADVALGTIREFLDTNKDKFDRIIICVFLEKDEEIYLKKLPEYFPLDAAHLSSKL